MRRLELDGLRGLAALSVAVSHFIDMLPQQGLVASLQHSPLHILWDGEAAVTLFFVLSGFVLALPAASGKSVDLPVFWTKRVFRLYPAYWFAIGLCMALMPFFRPEHLKGLSPWIQSFWHTPVPTLELIKTLVMVGPKFNTHLIDPPIWTLQIEMSVSILLPFFIILMQRWRGMLMGAAVILCCIALTLFQGRFRMLDIFLLGSALSFLYKPIVAYLSTGPRFVLGVTLLAGVAFYGITQLGLSLSSPVKIELQAVGSALLMLGVMASDRVAGLLSSRVPQFLGEVSYSLYLLHFPILLMAASLLYPIAGIWVVGVVTLSVSLAISYVVYRGIELPFVRLGQRVKLPRQQVLNRA